MGGATVATALAGCSGGGSTGGGESTPTDEPDRDNDGVPDARDDFPNDSSLSAVVSTEDDTRQIEEDEWWWYELELPEDGQLSYEFIVRDGPEIDVIVVEESEYSYFEEGERYEYLTDPSALDTAGEEVSSALSSGEYRMIFDNTSRGEADPPSNLSNDVIEVDFNYTLAV
jgi:hypothetical protein